jgi:hypothetical protein
MPSRIAKEKHHLNNFHQARTLGRIHLTDPKSQ